VPVVEEAKEVVVPGVEEAKLETQEYPDTYNEDFDHSAPQQEQNFQEMQPQTPDQKCQIRDASLFKGLQNFKKELTNLKEQQSKLEQTIQDGSQTLQKLEENFEEIKQGLEKNIELMEGVETAFAASKIEATKPQPPPVKEEGQMGEENLVL